jgi:hypothetical protein
MLRSLGDLVNLDWLMGTLENIVNLGQSSLSIQHLVLLEQQIYHTKTEFNKTWHFA